MQNQPENKRLQARQHAREVLAQSPSFKTMSLDEQKNIYRQLVEEELGRLEEPSQAMFLGDIIGGITNAVSGVANAVTGGGSKRASDLINDKRHDKDFGVGMDALGEMMETVNFPVFVKDLLKAVFDANITVMRDQTTEYIRLLKEATKDVSQFIKAIDPTAAFGYLAENKSDEFSLGEDENGNVTLNDRDGNELARGNEDIGDNALKAKIMDAKIQMAREHRAILREIILMGVTRLVVDKGKVEAEVLFDYNATRKVNRADQAMNKSRTSSGLGTGGGLFSFLGGHSSSNSSEQTTLSVASTKSVAEDKLQAKLRGKVDIQFKTDYFKLDNFATMYGGINANEQKAAGGGAPAPAAPAPAAPR